MADNVAITAGSGTSIATDDVGGVQYQRVKIAIGADGAAADVAATAPMFVRLSDGSAAITALPITDNSGSLTVDNGGTFAVQSTIQAGTALIGKVVASDDVSSLYDGTTVLTPKFAAIAASSSGNNTLVAAVNPKKIRVLALSLISNGTVNVKFQTGAGGTDLTGLYYLVANAGFVLPYNPTGWFETASNTLLNANLSGAVAVGGCLTYVEV